MSDDSTQTVCCPKCGEAMESAEAGDCTVERCTGCAGIWLDAKERLRLLQDKKQVKSLDTGWPAVGTENDELTEIDCPFCNVRMRHVSDRAQKHIGFERCPDCDGMYFDAGEMTDLAEFTMVERIRAFFGKGG